MAKLLVLINSGPRDSAKAVAGLAFARVAKDSGRLEDVKACFFAEGVELLSAASLPTYARYVDALIERGVFLMACQAHAESQGIADEIRGLSGVDLHYVGEDLISAVAEGYEVISF